MFKCYFRKIIYAAITLFVTSATFANISYAAEKIALPPATYKPLPEGTKVKYDNWAFEVKEIKDDKFNFVIKDTKSGDWFRFYGIFEFEGSGAHLTGVAHGGNTYSSTELDENSKSLLKKLWSLEVGKKVSYVYEETAWRGKYSRKNKVSIEITGTELLQLNGFQYPTYVIKEKSSAPDILLGRGRRRIFGFEFIQTYWYHPGSGLILKSTREWIKKPKIGTIRTGDYSLVSVQFPENTTTHKLKGVSLAELRKKKDKEKEKLEENLKNQRQAAEEERQRAQRALELEQTRRSKEAAIKKAEEALKRKARETARKKAEAKRKQKAREEAQRVVAAERKQKAKEEAQRVAEAERKRKASEDAEQKKIAMFKRDESLNYLFKGADKDILFLFNETGNAKHGVRGLDGKLVFDNNIVSFCGLFGFKVDRSIRDYVALSLSKTGVDGTLLPKVLKKCGDLKKNNKDLIVFERGTFLSQPLDKIKGVLDFSSNGKFTKFSVFEFEAHQRMLAARTQKSKDIIANLKKEEMSGFGLLLPKAIGRTVCTVKDEDQKTIKLVLSKFLNNDPISLKGLSPKKIVAAPLNNNFIKLKKNKCGYLIASAGSLRKLIPGLKRDKIKFSMHHEWMPLDAVTKKKKEEEKKALEASRVKTSARVGEATSVGGVQIKIISKEEREEVGDGFTDFQSNAKHLIIAIIWEIRNKTGNLKDYSGSPIQIFVADSKGTKQSPSDRATEAYSAEVGHQSSVPRQLSTGDIKLIATAFVVSSGLLKKGGMKIIITTPDGDLVLQ